MKKGFTLIELLAVIVILAIIALIATPIVLNIIEESKENASLRSAEMYLDAVEFAVGNKNMEKAFRPTLCIIQNNGNLQCGSEILEIEVNGEIPTSGTIIFEDGKINDYQNLFLGEKYICKGENGIEAKAEATKILYTTDESGTKKEALCVPSDASTVTTGNIPSGTYTNGDEYLCEVSDGIVYNFFVVSKDDNEGIVNLIADRNMTLDASGNTIPATTDNTGAPAWVSVEDYNNDAYPKVDAACEADATHTCYNSGPVTALNRLDAVVANWTNLPLKNYETQEYPVTSSNASLGQQPGEWRYITDTGWPIYNKITRNTRARMLTAQEAVNNGCMFEYDETVDGVTTKYFLGTCPLYMVNYTQFKDPTATYENPDAEIAAKFEGYQAVSGVRGYWLSTSNVGYGTNGHCGIGIHDNAVLNCTYTSRAEYYGVRPVITLTKTELG